MSKKDEEFGGDESDEDYEKEESDESDEDCEKQERNALEYQRVQKLFQKLMKTATKREKEADSEDFISDLYADSEILDAVTELVETIADCTGELGKGIMIYQYLHPSKMCERANVCLISLLLR